MYSHWKSRCSFPTSSHQIAFECFPDGRGTVEYEGRGDETVVGVIEDSNDQGLGLAVEEGQAVGGDHHHGEHEEDGQGVDSELGGD